MSAQVTDIQIINDPQGKWFEFTWAGDQQEWREALESLKGWVPYDARRFDPDTKRWQVHEDYEHVLGRIFDNFDRAIDALRSQLSLFGGEP